MNRFFVWLALVFFVAAPIRFFWCLYEDEDLNDPEAWDDWTRNPLIYVPMAIIVLLLAFVMLRHMCRVEKKR